MISLVFLIAIVLIAFTVPFFLPASLKGTSSDAFLPPLTKGLETPVLHLCGTDKNGQDLFYRLLTGAQVSLGVGIVGACISLVIGTLCGYPLFIYSRDMDKIVHPLIVVDARERAIERGGDRR